MSKGVEIYAGATVHEECKLRGDITIGAGTIIDPSASIIAEAGPIIIGERCVIEAQARIINNAPLGQVLTIGSGNIFGVDCSIEALNIGNRNIFQSKCFVGYKVTVTNECIIGAGCRLTEKQTLKPGTIINAANSSIGHTSKNAT